MKIMQNTENKTCQAKKREVARLFELLIWSRAASAWVCKAFDNIWKESRNTLRTPIPNFLGNIKGIINISGLLRTRIQGHYSREEGFSVSL